MKNVGHCVAVFAQMAPPVLHRSHRSPPRVSSGASMVAESVVDSGGPGTEFRVGLGCWTRSRADGSENSRGAGDWNGMPEHVPRGKVRPLKRRSIHGGSQILSRALM